MKKVSTAATKRNRNLSQPNLTIGPDLGDRSGCYCVLDETGRIVMEQKVSTTAKALQAAFGAMPRSRIALETGMHSPCDRERADEFDLLIGGFLKWVQSGDRVQ